MASSGRYALVDRGGLLCVTLHGAHEGGVRPRQRRHRERFAGVRVDLLGQHPRPKRPTRAPLEEPGRRREGIEVVGHRDVVLGEPQGRDEPRVAGNVRDVRRDLEVVVVLVARYAADRRSHGQAVLDRPHRGDHARIVRRQKPEQEDARKRDIDRRVLDDGAIG